MRLVGNLVLFVAVKEFYKSIKNWKSYSHGYGGTLLTHGVHRVRVTYFLHTYLCQVLFRHDGGKLCEIVVIVTSLS